MKKIKANSLTLEKVRNAAKAVFYNSTYKFYWDGDELRLCFKKNAGSDSFAFATTVQSLIEGLTVKHKIVDDNSDFWN